MCFFIANKNWILYSQKYIKNPRIFQGLGKSTPFSCIEKYQTIDKQQFEKQKSTPFFQ
jgi:hypothetical protein